MRDYGKVYSSFWTSETIRAMSEDARTLAFYLLTSPHSTIAGVFRLPDGYVCEDMQWTSERVAKGFAELFEKGYANRCATTKWVWVCKHLEWNPPENPNQRKSALKVAQSVPDECAWKQAFMRVSGELLGAEPPKDSNPSETVSEGFVNQKQEQEQEQDKEDGAKALPDSRPVDQCPHQDIIDLYHEALPAARRIRDWTPARQQALRARWRESAERQSLDWWSNFFGYVSKSDFLCGRVSSPNRKPFELSLDWLCKSENFVKVLEGAYEN